MKPGSAAAAALALLALCGCATAQKTYQHVVRANPCQEATVTLYFDRGSDLVTPEGREIMRLTAGRLKGCPVQELAILGLSDPVGSPESNLELSKRRAEHVRDAFIAAGLPVHAFTVRAEGATGAQAAAGVVEPVRRRVDVTVVMTPPEKHRAKAPRI